MELGLFFQCLVNGLAIGGIYAVVASGFTLVLGAMKIMNFGQGQFYMLGAFVAYGLCEVLHLHYAIGLVAAFVAMALLGVVLQRVIIRYTYEGFFHTVLATIAFATIINQIAVITFGKTDRFMARSLRVERYSGIVVSNDKLLLLILGVLLIIALHYFMKTKVGKLCVPSDRRLPVCRASTQNRCLSSSWPGMRSRGHSRSTGTACAGRTGGYGSHIFVKILLVIIIGGMGSMPGALLAALIIGLMRVSVISSSGVQRASAHLLFAALTLLQAGGLLGNPSRFRNRGKAMRKKIIICVSLILLLLLPLVVQNSYVLHLIIYACMYSALGMGFSMMWKNRLITAGTAGFWAVGGYTSALLVTRLGIPFWLAMPAAGVASGLCRLSSPLRCVAGRSSFGMSLVSSFIVMECTWHGLLLRRLGRVA
jgi:branched-subunit amino acid ABC-type transport system permease component